MERGVMASRWEEATRKCLGSTVPAASLALFPVPPPHPRMYRRHLGRIHRPPPFFPCLRRPIASTTATFVPWTNPFPEDEFIVTSTNGFLPRQDPLATLPSTYDVLDSLLERMPLMKANGYPGLLASGEFGSAVMHELPEYDLSGVQDVRLLSALYRDLTFVASAYLLEPCDASFRATGEYGLGRPVLPRRIAVPLQTAADKIGAKPFMEYALSYSLYNYKRVDPLSPPEFDNIRLIRAFSNSPDEAGFILVHVAMVRYSNDLVRSTMDVLERSRVSPQDRRRLAAAYSDLESVLGKINHVMETMWSRSDPSRYLSFRTFIMGSKNQPMFPKGVLYEGVSEEPLFFRGESGANDSMIPLMDNLLGVTEKLPENPLTQVLREFRSYRPRNHRAFLQWVYESATAWDTTGVARQGGDGATVAYLACLDRVREFRHRHWLFTKEYILRRTSHPVATGGSPIVTWLPNQLAALLDFMDEVAQGIKLDVLTAEEKERVAMLADKARVQRRILQREVNQIKERFGANATATQGQFALENHPEHQVAAP